MLTMRNNLIEKIQHKSYYPWVIWALCASFFFAEYLVRLEPSITKQQLMQAFNLNALGFGTLSSFFTFSYVLMQIPVGTMVDRFGAHILMVINTLICAIGCFVFAAATSIGAAEFGRLISGISSAFAFVGTLRLATYWFPSNKIGLIAGMTQAAGMLGATVGEGPFAIIVNMLGWRSTMWLIGGIILILGVLIAVIVKDKPDSIDNNLTNLEKGPKILVSLTTVLKNPQSWYNGIFVGLLYAPTAAFAELWGVPFLTETYNIDTTLAATGISAIFLGWTIGGPITGWISDRIKKRKPVIILSTIFSLILLCCILYLPNLPIMALFALLFLYGLSNTGVATSYAIASEINNTQVTGTSIAFANMTSVLVGAALQPVIGTLLDQKWNGLMLNNAPAYTLEAYQYALQSLPLCLALAVIFALLIKETNCKSIG